MQVSSNAHVSSIFVLNGHDELEALGCFQKYPREGHPQVELEFGRFADIGVVLYGFAIRLRLLGPPLGYRIDIGRLHRMAQSSPGGHLAGRWKFWARLTQQD